MKIGDIVRPDKPEGLLRSGCSEYGGAVVTSVDPFVLVSEHCDMCWKSMDAENYFIAGSISPQELDKYIERGR